MILLQTYYTGYGVRMVLIDTNKECVVKDFPANAYWDVRQKLLLQAERELKEPVMRFDWYKLQLVSVSKTNDHI